MSSTATRSILFAIGAVGGATYEEAVERVGFWAPATYLAVYALAIGAGGKKTFDLKTTALDAATLALGVGAGYGATKM